MAHKFLWRGQEQGGGRLLIFLGEADESTEIRQTRDPRIDQHASQIHVPVLKMNTPCRSRQEYRTKITNAQQSQSTRCFGGIITGIRTLREALLSSRPLFREAQPASSCHTFHEHRQPIAYSSICNPATPELAAEDMAHFDTVECRE